MPHPSHYLLFRSNLTTQKARDSRGRTHRVAVASQNTNNNTDRVNSDVKEQMVLYSKLFIVMGIAWSCSLMPGHVHIFNSIAVLSFKLWWRTKRGTVHWCLQRRKELTYFVVYNSRFDYNLLLQKSYSTKMFFRQNEDLCILCIV